MTRALDPRVWLLWGVATGLPALIGRNPFPLLAALLVVLAVRAVWLPVAGRDTPWAGVWRLGLIIAAVAVVFNLLTAPIGDRVLVRLPGWWPLGDVMTWNALTYGALTGLALLTLVLTVSTVSMVIDWPEVLRLLPRRLAAVAVATSIALTFIPQLARALRDIREAQAARGYETRGGRGLLPLLSPLLAGGLERATTLAEALEARGFGGNQAGGRSGRVSVWTGVVNGLGTVVGLTLLVSGGYGLAAGDPRVALGLLLSGMALLVIAGWRSDAHGVTRTRYRTRSWRMADTAVSAASLTVIGATVVAVVVAPDALRYEPYPNLTVPISRPLLLVLFALLLAPALVAPTMGRTGELRRRAPEVPTSAPRAWWDQPGRTWEAVPTGPVEVAASRRADPRDEVA